MISNQGKILYTIQDRICFLKIEGVIKYTADNGFNEFVKRISRDATIENILIDLSEASYIDSTNLGLIAIIARTWIQKYRFKPTLLATTKTAREIIENVGLDKVFVTVRESEDRHNGLNEVSTDEKSALESARVVLKAHQALVAIDGKNKIRFRDVVELLQEELGEWPE